MFANTQDYTCIQDIIQLAYIAGNMVFSFEVFVLLIVPVLKFLRAWHKIYL